MTLTRRALLGQGLGLCLLVALPAAASPAADAREDRPPGEPVDEEVPFGAWLRVAPDGAVTVMLAATELGQGVMTALPMLVAEELDIPLDRVRVRFAPAARAYRFSFGEEGPIRMQLTGGSRSVAQLSEPMRRAGATARALLVAAAARRWGLPAGRLHTAEGAVHGPGGRRLGYGELAAEAAALPVPRGVRLKPPSRWKLLGTSPPRLDTPAKVLGTAVFGIDARLPDQLAATVRAAPSFGGRLRALDPAPALAVPGVEDVVVEDTWFAVVARDTWTAFRAARALRPDWEPGPHAGLDTKTVEDHLAARLDADRGFRVRGDGDLDRALARAARTLEAEYRLPYLHHATLEPMNATALVDGDRAEVWVPTQNQQQSLTALHRATGVPRSRCRVHTTLAGGGFGRRAEVDVVEQVGRVARRFPGRPVALVWTREEDFTHGFYRPAVTARLRGGVDASGRPIAYGVHLCGTNIAERYVPPALANRGPFLNFVVEGLAELPYALGAVEVRFTRAELPVPVGSWRSVGNSHNAVFKECFIDELLALGGRDPVEGRLELLRDAPDHARVLRLAAETAGWGGPGGARGVAVHASFGSVVATVVEVSVEDDRLRVERITAAADCGPVVHPDIVRQQVEGGSLFALSAALHGGLEFRDGGVAQDNFHAYPVLRLARAPAVDVRLVRGSRRSRGGVGEIAVPPLAPALLNAVRAATGRAVRSLPLSRHFTV